MTRTPISRSAREGYRKVVELDAYVAESLGADLMNLVYLRASLVNGCNYCVDSHSSDLRAGGMPERKVMSVATWHESAFFTEQERLVLELTDAVTDISGGVDDGLWERAEAKLGEKGLGDLILAIGTIAIWNRIGISTHLPTPPLAG